MEFQKYNVKEKRKIKEKKKKKQGYKNYKIYMKFALKKNESFFLGSNSRL